MKLWQERAQSAIGNIVVVTSDHELCSLDYEGYEERMHRLLLKRFGPVKLNDSPRESFAMKALYRYLSGELDAFDSVELRLQGTEFQERVWRDVNEHLVRVDVRRP